MTPEIALTRTADADPAVALPCYATPGAAGADVRANFGGSLRSHGMTIEPGGRALVPTGLRAAVPPGFEIQIRPRSGLALKQGLSVANSPGTIDSDYRGPLGVIAINLGSAPVTIAHGDRIAQLVVAPVVQAGFSLTDALDDTGRGSDGFGSTGVG